MSEAKNDEAFVVTADVAAFVASDAVAQFVIKNVDYYRAKWVEMIAKAGSLEAFRKRDRVSWNWAAFLFSWAWLLYRKMYLLGLVAAVASFGLAFSKELFGTDASGALIGLSIVISLYGNSWYFRHAHKRITEIQATAQDTNTRQVFLAAAGGTNAPAAVGGSVLAMCVAATLTFAPGKFANPSSADVPALRMTSPINTSAPIEPETPAIGGESGSPRIEEVSALADYNCTSLRSEIIDLSERDRATKGFALVHIYEPQTVSNARNQLECSGRALWSDQDETRITFGARVDSEDNIIINYEIPQ